MSQEVTTMNRTTLGFWIYLMTDCMLFAALFATFAVLRASTNGGPAGSDLFDLPYVMLETMALLISSFSCGLAVWAYQNNRRQLMVQLLVLTGLLGLTFLGLELSEFHKLIVEGNGPSRSGFLSSYFTLVGTHGLHITVGLIWLATLLVQILKGAGKSLYRRLTLFSLFWHFLDVVWIFIFSVVYLWGHIA